MTMPIKSLIEQLVGTINGAQHSLPPLVIERAVSQFIREIHDMRVIHMARKTYTIDVKIRFDDDERHKMMLRLMQRAAKQILAQASLLSDAAEPMIALKTEDAFYGTDEINLAVDEDNTDV